MDNINPYDKESFKKEFPNTEHYRLIKELYPTAEIFYDDPLRLPYTREELFFNHSIIDATPFYYLQYLDPNVTIHDLGCGFNFFKPFFKNLIGIDPNDARADIHETVNAKYYQEHESCYDALISINALHFVPIHYIRDVCESFTMMLKPGCTGVITLNLARMLEKTENRDAWSPYHTNEPSFLDGWVRKQFDNFPHEFKVIDINLATFNQYMNGNVRLVITRSS